MKIAIHSSEVKNGRKRGLPAECQFRLAFEVAAVGMLVQGVDARVLKTNKALRDMLGYTHGELARSGMDPLVHPDDLALSMALRHDLLQGRRDSYQLEKRYLHKDGRTVWCKVDTSLVRDVADKPCLSVSVVEDISDRKQFEASARRTAERYEVVFNAARWGIIGVTTERKIVFANAAALAMLGWQAEELFGQPVNTILANEGVGTGADDAIRRAIQGAGSDGLIRHAERCAMVRRSGVPVAVECTVAPIVEGNVVTGMTLLVQEAGEHRTMPGAHRQEEPFRTQAPGAVPAQPGEGS